MDENAYRDTYNALNQNDCPFEKALEICRHACQNSLHIGIGERLAIGCASTEARKTCRELLALLHDNAAFALHQTDMSVLPPSSAGVASFQKLYQREPEGSETSRCACALSTGATKNASPRR